MNHPQGNPQANGPGGQARLPQLLPQLQPQVARHGQQQPTNPGGSPGHFQMQSTPTTLGGSPGHFQVPTTATTLGGSPGNSPGHFQVQSPYCPNTAAMASMANYSGWMQTVGSPVGACMPMDSPSNNIPNSSQSISNSNQSAMLLYQQAQFQHHQQQQQQQQNFAMAAAAMSSGHPGAAAASAYPYNLMLSPFTAGGMSSVNPFMTSQNVSPGGKKNLSQNHLFLIFGFQYFRHLFYVSIFSTHSIQFLFFLVSAMASGLYLPQGNVNYFGLQSALPGTLFFLF